jgi:opine dehydrogenase
MQSRKVTIMGAGNGGRTAAAELALRGHEVTMYESPLFAEKVKVLLETRKIISNGVINGEAEIKKITFDVSEAIQGSEVIIIIVPTNYHINYARLLAPYLKDGHNIVLIPGSLGSLEIAEEFRKNNIKLDITISEFAALPYATRIVGPNTVKVFGRRAVLSIGVFPSNKVERVAKIMNDLYPGIQLMRDVFEAGLSNPNPTLHCLGVLLNSGRIEYSHGEFYYYEEGMTPGVCRAIEAIDQERINIGKALGLNIISLKDTYPIMKYGPKGENLWQVIRGVEPLIGIKGPSDLKSRYITEDVPIGILCYSQLGRRLGIDVKLMESVIYLASAILDMNFIKNGRTIKKCGINNMEAYEMINFVKNGKSN